MNVFSKKVRTVGSIFIAFFFITPSLAFALKFKQIVTFGDSLSDHGNLHMYVTMYPETRTNGDVWVDYLRKELNADLKNYAVIGAMTSKHLYDDIQKMSDNEAIPQLGLTDQIDRYIAEGNEFKPSETLFTVWIGANNLIRLGYDIEAKIIENMDNPDFDLQATTQTMTQDMIVHAMTDMTYAFTTLFNLGVKHIVVLTLPDIGKAPWYNQRSEMEIEAATALATAFNNSLLSTLDLVTANYSDVTVYKFDLFQIMDDVLEKDMFKNETGSYLKLDEAGYIIALTETNGPPEDYLFYDAVHPMTRAHEYFSTVVAERVIYHGCVTQQELNDAVIDERMKWDVKNDNRIGIEEAIQALKICSGMKPND